MSAIGNIAINDGASTPATHTFTPSTTNPATYRNGASEASVNGLVYDESLKMDIKVVPDGVSKGSIQLKIPHLDLVGVSTEMSYETVNVEFLFSKRSSAARRKNARVLASNLLLNSQVVDAIDNLNPPY